jgi:hypothetical protein
VDAGELSHVKSFGMAEVTVDPNVEMRRRFWDILVIPLFVGLLLAVAAYFAPRVFEAGKQLSYTVEKPSDYLSERLQGVTIQVNGTPTSSLFVTKVRIWNSGSVALKDVSILFEFDPADQTFRILNVAHATKPEREFGNIAEASPDVNSARFTYSLLNRGDEDTVSFLTNESVQPKIYAKAEDLSLLEAAAPHRATPIRVSLLIGLVGLLASVLSMVVSSLRAQERLTQLLFTLHEARTAVAKTREAAEKAFGNKVKQD